MIRNGFVIVGYGKMGRRIEDILKERKEKIKGIVSSRKSSVLDKTILKRSKTAFIFTSVENAYESTKMVLGFGTNAVIGTTEFYLNPDRTENEEMLSKLRELAIKNNCRAIYSPNYSIGFNLFLENIRELAKKMHLSGYDVCIEETHHRNKEGISGSAMSLASAVNESYSRRVNTNPSNGGIAADEITISSSRIGNIAGIHKVIFASPVDRIEQIHTVTDPRVFAIGAVDSAYWLTGMPPGLYTMQDRLRGLSQ